MRSTSLEKSHTKRSGKASPRHLYEKSKLTISLDKQSEIF